MRFEGIDLLHLSTAPAPAGWSARTWRWCSRSRCPASIPAIPWAGRSPRRCARTTPCRRPQVRDRVVELLDQVGIPAPASRLGAFPHQLSGGMNQRVMIAMAISCNPEAADRRRADHRARRHHPEADPRAADRSAARSAAWALVLITHDMGVVAETAHRVQVMYAGQMVEEQTDRRAVRQRRAIPTPRHCSTRCRSGPSAAAGCRPSPAWCPASTTGPRGCLFNPRCALRRPTAAATTPAALAGAADGVCALPLSAAEARGRGAGMTRADGGAGPAPPLPGRRRAVRQARAW